MCIYKTEYYRYLWLCLSVMEHGQHQRIVNVRLAWHIQIMVRKSRTFQLILVWRYWIRCMMPLKFHTYRPQNRQRMPEIPDKRQFKQVHTLTYYVHTCTHHVQICMYNIVCTHVYTKCIYMYVHSMYQVHRWTKHEWTYHIHLCTLYIQLCYAHVPVFHCVLVQ